MRNVFCFTWPKNCNENNHQFKLFGTSTHACGARLTLSWTSFSEHVESIQTQFFATNNVTNFLIQMLWNFSAPVQNKANNRKASSISRHRTSTNNFAQTPQTHL